MMVDAAKLLETYGPKQVRVLNLDRQVISLRYSPDGKTLASGGFDGLVRRWDLSGEEPAARAPLAGHNGWIEGVAFAPSGELLFTADTWGEIRAWPNAQENAEPAWKIPAAHDGWIRALAVSPDGKTLASCGRDGVIRLWSTADGAKVREIDGHREDLFCLRFHPDGKLLVAGDMKGKVCAWEVETGQCARQFDAGVLYTYRNIQETGGVRCLAFNHDATLLAVGGTAPATAGNVTGDPTVLVFDFATGEQKHTLVFGDRNAVFVHDVFFHRDGFLMLVTSGTPGNGQFVFQRLEDEQPFFKSTTMANCLSLGMHPGGQQMVVAATNKGSNGNGRRLDKDGEYAGNWSPLHFFQLPAPAAAEG